MFSKKRKILFCSEASFARTGFGTIYYELISRIHKSGKFRVAEFATNAYVNDPNDHKISWRLYPNEVYPNDPRYKELANDERNRFGKWRFDKVLLDFEPDIVVDIRDPNCFEHEILSPLRPYYHWCIGPTVDSAPQPIDWVRLFVDADSVVPYTNFGCDVLKLENPNINVVRDHGFGVNQDVFKPIDRAMNRSQLGIAENIKILGYVSRNQVRKLFPSLLEAFKTFLSEAEPELAENCMLHLHTAYPDSRPWNIAKLLIERGLENKVLFTYYCVSCQNLEVTTWKGAHCYCKKCKNAFGMTHSGSAKGCSNELMNRIYNLYDAYIQFSNCEGLGIGVLEAASVGMPLMAVGYSAMSELMQKLDGVSISYTLARDVNTDAERAVPDLRDTVRAIREVLSLSKEEMANWGNKTRQLCLEHYDWNKVADKWTSLLENIELKNLQGRWGAPLESKTVGVGSETLLGKIIAALREANRHDVIDIGEAYKIYDRYLLHRAGYGIYGLSGADVNQIIDIFKNDYENIMSVNLGLREMLSEDFIRYADMKELVNMEVK